MEFHGVPEDLRVISGGFQRPPRKPDWVSRVFLQGVLRGLRDTSGDFRRPQECFKGRFRVSQGRFMKLKFI